MNNKNLLHRNQLLNFTNWLIGQDAKLLEHKGPFEVLRFKTGDAGQMPIIYNRPLNCSHLACNEEATEFVRQFIEWKKLK